MMQERRKPETHIERIMREQKESDEYYNKTHKADGNDIKRLEDKLDKILELLQ